MLSKRIIACLDVRDGPAHQPLKLPIRDQRRVLGDDLCGASMSSTKSAIGHLLGGAGADVGLQQVQRVPVVEERVGVVAGEATVSVSGDLAPL